MDIDRHELTQTVLLAVAVLAAGFFAGLTVASQLALNATAPLTLPAWAGVVEQLRLAAAAIAALGLVALLALEWTAESVTQ